MILVTFYCFSNYIVLYSPIYVLYSLKQVLYIIIIPCTMFEKISQKIQVIQEIYKHFLLLRMDK